jgi:hypothetical protein
MGLLDYQNFLLNEGALYESAMSPAQWEKDGGKYRKMFQEFLKDSTKELKIDPEFQKNFRVSAFKVFDITNLEEIIAYIAGGGAVSSKNPVMKVGKEEIPLTKLQKTGVFTTLSKSATDTDTKEGMVVYYYYNQDVDLMVMDADDAAQLVSNIPSGCLHPKVIEKIKNWIIAFDESNNVQANQWKSAANALSGFKNSGYLLDRYTVLTPIRAAARKLSGLSADNWCPGDVYLVDPSAKSSAISTAESATTIGEINLLFNNEFSPRPSSQEPMGSLLAISLKQEAARLGRAKEYLKTISPADAKYNLTKYELEKADSDEAWVKAEISSYQQKISTIAAESGINVSYTPSNVDLIKQQNLPDKLAAIKLAYHLLSLPNDDGDNLDSNLLSILKFGLKQSNKAVNPPYWKITGQSQGSAEIEFIHGGDELSLLVGGFDSRETNLVILDSSNRLDIVMFYYVAIGSQAYEIRLRAATTSSKQAGLEFEGKDYIGSVTQDPAGTNAAISAAFQKRSSMR